MSASGVLDTLTGVSAAAAQAQVSVSDFDGRELTCSRIGSSILLHQPTPQPGVAAIRVTLLAPAGIESESERGLRHAIEHVYLRELLEGPSREKLIPGNLGRYDVSGETTADQVTFSWWGPEPLLPAALEAFSKTLLKGDAPSERAIELESIRIRTEATRRSSCSQVQLSRDIQEALYPGSYHLSDTVGNADKLREITSASLQAMLRERILPSGVCISIVGGTREGLADMSSAIACLPSDLARSNLEDEKQVNVQPPEKPAPLIHRRTDSEIALVGIAFPNLECTDPRAYYTVLLRHSFGSLLQLLLQDIIYSPVQPLKSEARALGFQGSNFECLPEVLPQALDHARMIAHRLQSQVLPDSYFENLRNNLLESCVLGPSQSASGAAHLAEEYALGRIAHKDFKALAAFTQSMTNEQLREVASEILAPSRLAIVVHSPTLTLTPGSSATIVEL